MDSLAIECLLNKKEKDSIIARRARQVQKLDSLIVVAETDRDEFKLAYKSKLEDLAIVSSKFKDCRKQKKIYVILSLVVGLFAGWFVGSRSTI